MIELFVSAFVTFFVVIDPPGCAPIFASLTSGATAAHRRVMAVRSVLIAAAILLFFGLLGEDLLRALGISLAAFRIAGGIMRMTSRSVFALPGVKSRWPRAAGRSITW